jgi:hypothetical protein
LRIAARIHHQHVAEPGQREGMQQGCDIADHGAYGQGLSQHFIAFTDGPDGRIQGVGFVLGVVGDGAADMGPGGECLAPQVPFRQGAQIDRHAVNSSIVYTGTRYAADLKGAIS